MKKIVAILFLGIISLTAKAQDAAPADPNAPVFQFEEETIDYGKIEHNANGEREFVFTNVGKSPLVIEKVKGSCGCTVPTKPTEPILPGEQGVIKVKYDTSRLGGFTKTVTITSNASEPVKRVKIKGYIQAPGSVVEKKPTAVSAE